MKYSCPLNNVGLNCEGPLKHVYFSVVNTIVYMAHGWLNSRMWGNCGYGRLTISYTQINPHVVQGSIVYIYMDITGRIQSFKSKRKNKMWEGNLVD